MVHNTGHTGSRGDADYAVESVKGPHKSSALKSLLGRSAQRMQ
jgi:hypothetical protein